jgi:ubiquinone/menaquinone biosynthesis C-methylase UbiE
MTITEVPRRTGEYALARELHEYDRLRAQARVWEAATGRVLDRVDLVAGMSCLDAGCGPGETMRLMAQRVGPTGRVVGIDLDAALGVSGLGVLHAAGYRHCRFVPHDVNVDEPIPGAPFDLVYARLLLFHLPQRVAVLRRLWQAVAPGGHLLIQDYDLHNIEVLPSLASVEEIARVLVGAFEVLDCDIRAGVHLPALFAEAGVGAPDGTDVAGRIEPLSIGQHILEQTLRSVLPVAVAHGVTDEHQAAAALAALHQDVMRFPDHTVVWPLMYGAWRRKQ